MVVVARAAVVDFIVDVTVVVVVDEPESSLPQADSANAAERTIMPAPVRRTIEFEIRM